MEDRLQLVEPSTALEIEYRAFHREWAASGEPMTPWVIAKDPADFRAMVQLLQDSEQGANLPEGWVPSSTYWLVDGATRVLGVVNIRHRLNVFLRSEGGHIGYGIRPSERRKGYATRLLALALPRARALGISRALVVCDQDNLGSEKTIRKNGGVQDHSHTDADGNVTLRFWIDA